MIDLLDFGGRVVVVTGAATGMGGAATELLCKLGAEVHALDIKGVSAPVEQAIEVDLSLRPSIDAAIERLPASVDVLFNCAGVPGPPFSNLETTLVNFIGLRHLSEAMIERMGPGGAVASITSVAGMGWRKNLENVRALVDTPDFEAAEAWCEAHPDVVNGYIFSKQCIIVYTKLRASQLAHREIRVNCLSPAPTDTPMLPSFYAQVNQEFLDEHFQAPVGRNATPHEMAEPLLFLGSRAARFVSGHNLFVDYGYGGSVEIGERPELL